MSDPRKKSYRIVGGGLDGEIYDEVSDGDVEVLRQATKADRLEEVTPIAPIDQPRVPEGGGPSQPPKRKSPRGDVTIGPVSVEPRFDEDEDESSANMTVGEPEVIKSPRPSYDMVFTEDETSPPPPSPPPKPPPRRPNRPLPPEDAAPPEAYNFFEGAERALAPLGDPLREQIANLGGYVDAATRAFNETGYYGGSDELAAGLESLSGANFDDALAQERAANEHYATEYPWTTAAFRGAGFVPGMLIGRPVAAATQAVKGVVPNALRIGKTLIRPTAEGAVSGALSSDSDSVQQTLDDAGWGTLWGLGVSTIGQTLSELAPLIRRAGVRLRRSSAAPGTPEDLKTLGEQRGIDYMENGIEERFDELGLADGWKPQSAADVAKRILEGEGDQPSMLATAGEQIGNAVDTAQAIGARGDWKVPADELGRQAREIVSNVPQPGPNEFAKGRALLQVRNEIPGSPLEPAPPALPRELQAKKLAFQEHGKYPEGVGRPPPEHVRQANAYREGRRAVANELDQSIQAAGPEVHGDFVRGNRDYQDLKQFGEMAMDEAARVKAQRTFKNMGRYGAGASGVAGGALLSEQLGLGMAPGALAGGLLGGVVGDAVGGVGQKYGKDIVGLAGVKGGELLGELGPAVSATAGRLEPQTALDVPNATVAAIRAIKSDPTAMGAYSDLFMQAANEPNPDSATSTLILRLVQSDPDFRTYVLPMLRVGAVEQR